MQRTREAKPYAYHVLHFLEWHSDVRRIKGVTWYHVKRIASTHNVYINVCLWLTESRRPIRVRRKTRTWGWQSECRLFLYAWKTVDWSHRNSSSCKTSCVQEYILYYDFHVAQYQHMYTHARACEGTRDTWLELNQIYVYHIYIYICRWMIN